ncbi:MAG: YhcN/YlaJ family sporulation lipoprotein [Syntrophomonas sp.]|nr:YhcN/YlaJ family sporulation lipoprotein [Syntrophomonas sp.]
MKKKLIYLMCFSLMLLVFGSGCQNSAAKKPVVPKTKKTTQSANMTPSERRVLASKLSKMAEQVDGVKKATVVVADIGIANNITGNSKTNARMNQATAKNFNDNTIGSDAGINRRAPQGMIVMVGLTLSQNTKDMDKTNQIKSKVMNKLKAADRRISQVLVTTDPNMVKRITDVAAGILEGKPIKTFEKDIKNIDSSLRQQNTTF